MASCSNWHAQIRKQKNYEYQQDMMNLKIKMVHKLNFPPKHNTLLIFIITMWLLSCASEKDYIQKPQSLSSIRSHFFLVVLKISGMSENKSHVVTRWQKQHQGLEKTLSLSSCDSHIYQCQIQKSSPWAWIHPHWTSHWCMELSLASDWVDHYWMEAHPKHRNPLVLELERVEE